MAVKDFTANGPASSFEQEPLADVALFHPNVDVYEKGDQLIVTVEIPGADPKSINVDYEEGYFSVEAKVKPRIPEGAQLMLHEYELGDFERTLRIGKNIDRERITARCENGLLTVHLPKVGPKPKCVAVKTA